MVIALVRMINFAKIKVSSKEKTQSTTMTEEEFQATTTRRLDKIEETLERLVNEQEKSNIRIETYQKSSQQVVNLAFGLILTSALAIIIPVVMNR
ncbi:MAG: hypothetical protein AAGA80_13910 [Cyanobacteria bacterium P01_F01_bin.143]